MGQVFTEDGYQVDLSKVELISDKGSEFMVYKYIDSVIKLYKKDYKLSHLSLEELNFFKNILTQRILFPTGTLWNENHNLIGYRMSLITGEKSIEPDSVFSLFEELAIIKQDLDLLCSKSIILRDINLSNTIYNGHIFLIDPGNYLIDRLEEIILHMDIKDQAIQKEVNRIIISGEYDKVKNLTDSFTLEERQRLINEWNYDKINKLIDMLLFPRRNCIDPFKFRQIVQFIMKERNKNDFIYSLDVFKLYFNRELCVGDAIDDFIKTHIKDDPEEKKLFLSLY